MINKRNIKIIIIIITIVMTTKTIYAYTIGFGSYTPSNSGSWSYTEPTDPCPKNSDFYNEFGWCPKGDIGETIDGYEYNCFYTYHGYGWDTKLTINSIDLNGNSLLTNSISTEGHSFLSGTWIGLNNKEEKTVSWRVDEVKYTKTTYDYECIYSRKKTTPVTTCITKYVDDCGSNKFASISSSKCSTKCKNNGYKSGNFNKDNNTCTCKTCTKTKPVIECQSTNNEVTVDSDPYKVTGETKNYKCPKAPFNIKGVVYDTLKSQKQTKVIEEINNPPGELKKVCNSSSCGAAQGAVIGYVENPTSEVKYIDPNNYNEEKIKNGDSIKTLSAIPENIVGLVNCENNPKSQGKLSRIFRFMPKNVCLNTITGQIRYITTANGDTCKISKNEVEIPTITKNNDIYWRYFIPLDTKSNSDFFVKIEKSSTGNLDVNECKSVVENYPIKNDYTYKIQKLDGSSFTGPVKYDKEYIKNLDGYYGCKNNAKSLSKNECYIIMDNNPQNNDYTNYISGIHDESFIGDYDIKHDDKSYSDKTKIEHDKGCKISTKVNFLVKQEFYGEKSNNNALKGYGMFFRQIDINNPFPNGLTKESYWYGLYNSGKVNGKELTTSFGNKSTYVANITNSAANAIRKFNNNTAYTKWVRDNTVRNGMNTNGTSDFIRINNDTKSIFDKKAPTNSFYKLGCGPTNKDWSWCKS